MYDGARVMNHGDEPAALLALIAGLLAESRPSGAAAPAPTLDSALDRDLGIDSLARVELMLRIERAFGVRMPEHLLGEARTPRDLLHAILAGGARRAAPAEPTPIVQPQASQRPDDATTIVAAFDWHVAHHADRVHLMILDAEGEGEPVTYGELRAEAGRLAAGLADRGVGAGQAVAIMLPTGRDFFRAFLGIVLAGAIPVPIYPPTRWAEIEDHLRRQSRILDNCRAVALVTLEEGTRAARLLQGWVPTLERVATVAQLSSSRSPEPAFARGPSDLALLQYTSGSTGDPKGVALTHANLLANIRAMGRAVGAGPSDVFVSWLPLYHDMGLIGAWMGGMYFAFPLVVMAPTVFLNRPSRWLRAVHRYRATFSAAPNFAYEILATRVDERDLEGLDLSSWRIAFNGAEPVSPDTLERFAARFARYGLRREALTPVYGLAECSVGLAFPPPGRGPLVDRVDRSALALSAIAAPARADDERALRFVACGVPIPGHEVRIVGADGREAGERAEGRVQFRGPSATSGYYRNPEKTRALFDGAWLDTGDVGYVAGGELYVTSRAKDLIIRGGQHVHPYELEEAVGALAGVRKGCVAVFGVTDRVAGTEKVVVLAETRLAPGEAADRLRAEIAAVALRILGTSADDIVLAPPHTVLKTSSGKIRRAASRELYEHGLAAGRPAAWRKQAHFALALAGARLRRLARMGAHAAFGAWAWACAAVLASLAIPACLLPRPWGRRALRALARALVSGTGLPVATRGLEEIPREGPVVIVANHASYIDGPLLFALLARPVRFVVKRELAGNRLVAWVLRAAGAGYVERFEAERGARDTRELVECARAGEALVFFAEGTFTRAPGLGPFHMGAFVTAAETGAPLVTVALRGTRSVLRDGQWLPRRSAVQAIAGPPLRADGDDWRAAVRLRDAARAEILARCGEPDLAGAGNVGAPVA